MEAVQAIEVAGRRVNLNASVGDIRRDANARGNWIVPQSAGARSGGLWPSWATPETLKFDGQRPSLLGDTL